WGKATKRAKIAGVTFHDLRGTAVTRLAIAGCTEAEIATITGHSLRSVRAIIDTHYLSRDPALAENAIRKLERERSSNENSKIRQTGLQNDGGFVGRRRKRTKRNQLAGKLGFEPRLTESESAVLPLNYPPTRSPPIT